MRLGATLLCLLLWCAAAGAAGSDEAAALWAELRQEGRVALVRHAATSGGVGDPPGFRLEDCTTQRNLTEQGRADARALGERFRSHAIDVGKVLSSQWCRCRETAELMALGPIETAPTFNNAFILRDRVDALTAGARAVIAAWTGPRVLVVVTHGANIRPLTGTDPGEGGLMVVVPDRALAAGFRLLGRIPPSR
jgi:phosphohistidine phosphatase SixA